MGRKWEKEASFSHLAFIYLILPVFFLFVRPPVHPMLAFLVISPCASRPLKKAYHDAGPPSSTILVFPR